MKQPPDHGKLVRAMAVLEAHRQAFRDHRRHLQDRARDQLDSMGHPLAVAEDFTRAGAGGVLAHRYHRARLVERHRLTAIAEGDGYGNPE